MLRFQHISKSFAGVKAVQDVSLEFNASQVHAVCGENGAGKSTLMHIIMGNLQPDYGKIFWRNQEIKIADVLFAQPLGISIVYQDSTLATPLTIAENIFPVKIPVTKSGLIDYKRLFAETSTLLNELGLGMLSPSTIVGKLSVAQQKMVEIAKAIAQKSSLLILDEPTASLTHSEAEILFGIINRLKEKGTAIIYISHRMAEISRIADVVSVLKDGKYMGTVPGITNSDEIIRMMVGRELDKIEASNHVQPEKKLQIKNISGRHFRNVSFDLHKGEILGLAGLEGSGRSAVARAIFGDELINDGAILKDGKELMYDHPGDAMNNGIAYVPEDRKKEGLFIERSVAENIFSVQLQNGWYDHHAVHEKSASLAKSFNIKTSTTRSPVRQLSGGNQQKVVLTKWLARDPDVIIVNEPTHGVDVGAKAEIYRLLKSLTSQGKSILLISSELPELLLLSDRIAIMHEGMIVDIIERNEATEELIAARASGIRK